MNFLEQAISGMNGILPSNALPALGDRLKKLLGMNDAQAQAETAPPIEQPKVEMPELTTLPSNEEFQAGTTRLSALLKGVDMILQNRNNIRAKNEELKIKQAERAQDRQTSREDLAFKFEQEGKFREAEDQRRAGHEEKILKMKQELDQSDPMYKAKLQYLNKQIDNYGKGQHGGGGSDGGRIIQTKDGIFQISKDNNGMPVLKKVQEQKGPLQSLMEFFGGGKSPGGQKYKPFQDKLNRYTDANDVEHSDVIRYDSATGGIVDIMDYKDYKQGLRGQSAPAVDEETPKNGLSIIDKYKNKKTTPAAGVTPAGGKRALIEPKL